MTAAKYNMSIPHGLVYQDINSDTKLSSLVKRRGVDGGTVKPFIGSHPKCVKVASQKGWPLMRGGHCAISRTHVFLCVLVDHWGVIARG